MICEKCKAKVAVYQKDGPGLLKRLYVDRIIEPVVNPKKNLMCEKCKTILGVPIIYQKEKRPAFRLFVGAICKNNIRKSASG